MVRQHNADCQEKEIPKAPEQAEGGWLGAHTRLICQGQKHIGTARWAEPCQGN